MSRYAATTPPILRWMQETNRNQPYARQVKPFGFLMSLFADPFFSPGPSSSAEDAEPARRARPRRWRPIAPFNQDHTEAVNAAFDRETGEPVPSGALRTVTEVVSAYHLHPESKFLNADYLDRGVTRRRHIFVSGVRHIGKEANRWEEQHFLGLDEDAQPDYGVAPEDMEVKLMVLRATIKAFGMGRWHAGSACLRRWSGERCGAWCLRRLRQSSGCCSRPRSWRTKRQSGQCACRMLRWAAGQARRRACRVCTARLG